MAELVWRNVTVNVPDKDVDYYLSRGFSRKKRATQTEPVADAPKKRGRPKKS